MFPFYGWGSRLEPLRGGSRLFTAKFLEISGSYFINIGKMSQSWSHPVVSNLGPLDWESSILTTMPFLVLINLEIYKTKRNLCLHHF